MLCKQDKWWWFVMLKTKLSNRTLGDVAVLLVDQGVIDQSALDSKNKHAARDVLRACLDAYMTAIVTGYQRVLEEGRKRWGEKRLVDFMITGEAVDPKEVAEVGMQEAVHYSDEAMSEVYELATNLRERRDWEAATSIFTFLIYLNPHVAWFWQGLGDCWRETSQWEAAQFAYGTAINCDPTNPELYRNLVNLLLELEENAKAQAILEFGLQQMNEQPRTRELAEATELLDAALAYVKSLATKRRR